MSVTKLRNLAKKAVPDGFNQLDDLDIMEDFDRRREIWEQKLDAGILQAKEEVLDLTLTKVEMQKQIDELLADCERLQLELSESIKQNKALANEIKDLSLLIYGNMYGFNHKKYFLNICKIVYFCKCKSFYFRFRCIN